MYNTLIIVGRLGNDPEMRFSPDGTAVTNFSVAVNTGYGDNKSTMWVRVSVWGKQAESSNQYLKKGSMVLVEGSLKHDKTTGGPVVWESKGKHGSAFEMNASVVRFLSSKGDSPAASNAEPASTGTYTPTEDEMPF